MRKKQMTALCLLVAGTLLTACGSGGKSADKTAAAADSSAAVSAASESTSETSGQTAQNAEMASSAVSGTAGVQDKKAVSGSQGISGETSGPTEEASILQLTGQYGYPVETDDDGVLLVHGSYMMPGLSDSEKENTEIDYAALQKALADCGDSIKKRVESTVSDYAQDAKDTRETFGDGFSALQETSTLDVCRADTRAVSLLETWDTYAGGAHPNYVYYSYNFDPKTGKALQLSDVLTDTSSLPETIAAILQKNYDPDAWIVDSLPDAIGKMIDGTKDASGEDFGSEMSWTLDSRGITFHFEPYALAAFAVGSQEALLPYDEYSDLFVPAYTGAPADYIRRLDTWQSVDIVKPDGSTAELSVYADTGEDDSKTFTVTLDDQSVSSQYTGFDGVPWLMHTSGKNRLLLDLTLESDWHEVVVFDLDSDQLQDGTMMDNAGLQAVPTDPQNFRMESRCQLLSTYSADMRYRIGDDGMPEALDRFEEIPSREEMNRLTTKKEMTVDILQSAESDETKEEKLPKGTELQFYRTDGDSIVDMLLKDGRIVRFTLHMEKYPYTLDSGESVEDCFDGMMYAG